MLKSMTQFPAHRFRIQPVGVLIWNAVLVMFLALGFLAVGSAAGDTGPTFSKDVAPILFKNCVKCHQTGELASKVPLVSYDAVRPLAESIKQKVMSRQMPPWPADPDRSLKFRNDPRLSQENIDTIVAWVNAGAPKGNDSDLPSMPKFEGGWMHPQGVKPDLVISLPGDVHVPAKGAIPYVGLLVKVPFSDDRWVVASQTRAGNPAVVHHMAITEVALNDGMSAADRDQLALAARQMGLPNVHGSSQPAVTTQSNPDQIDMLGIYTPGSTFEMYGENSAKLLRGGENMYLNFNVHYETIGTPETDRSMIAFWFQPGPPRHQLFRVNGAGETIIADGKEILTDAPGTKAEGTRVAIPPIPPLAENYEVIGVTGYPEPITIYQFQPHAHHRGKDFTYTVVHPDGREETVLSVPKFDHRWQMAYELETPLKLPAGSKLVVTAHYDNSMMNMHNPAPDKEVYFRDMNQSWDEMFTPFIQYTIDSQDLPTPQPHQREEKTNTSQQQERLKIAEVVGCLERNPPGKWMLTSAADPVASATQSTSSVALKSAQDKPLGSRRYRLLGASVFNPSSHRGEKVAVRGILIKDSEETRVNVTSLQMIATSCSK
jgi:copper type II ascorbate-dependent monooxygenase-like protein